MPATQAQPQLQYLMLSQLRLSKTNPRKSYDEAFVDELALSIAEKGVIQPILVRPIDKNNFEIICGERRFRASQKANKLNSQNATTIPAIIRNTTDDEMLELQITENLQRQDVHPLDEASAFQRLIHERKWDHAEIAKRFGKSEPFVAQRLKLNDLIPDAKKLFFGNQLLIGHAILLCRLMPDDQKEVLKHQAEFGSKEFKSVQSFDSFIKHNVIHNLSSGAWKKDDEKLLPEAGSCLKCQKRSGANPSLFPDIKEKDRCFDRACFDKKGELFLINLVQQTVDEFPETYFLSDHYSKTSPAVEKLLKNYKVQVLKEYSDFSTLKKSNLQGLFINGEQAGRIVPINITSKKASVKINEADKPSIEISGIEERQKRALELDAEKVYARVLDDFQKLNKVHKNLSFTREAEAALWWLLIDLTSDYDLEKKFTEVDFYQTQKRLLKLTSREKSLIVRKAFLQKYPENAPTEMQAYFMASMAKAFGIPVSKYEAEQKAIASKRIERAADRIEALKKKSSPKKATA